MILECKNCANVRPIMKTGGLICPQCRIILKYPHEPEYIEERQKLIDLKETIQKELDKSFKI